MKRRLKLQRTNRFKKFLATFSILATLGSLVTGIPQDIVKMYEARQDNQDNIAFIEDHINPEYEEAVLENPDISENPEISSDYIPKYDIEALRRDNNNELISGVIEASFMDGPAVVVEVNTPEESDYYLNHLENGEESQIGSVVKWGNEIYAHSFHNNSNIRFTGIEKMVNQEYFDEHNEITYYTEDGVYDLNVYAFTKEDPRNTRLTGEENFDELNQKVQDAKANSIVQTNVDVDVNNEQGIIYSCTPEGSKNTDERYCLHWTKTPILEKTANKTL